MHYQIPWPQLFLQIVSSTLLYKALSSLAKIPTKNNSVVLSELLWTTVFHHYWPRLKKRLCCSPEILLRLAAHFYELQPYQSLADGSTSQSTWMILNVTVIHNVYFQMTVYNGSILWFIRFYGLFEFVTTRTCATRIRFAMSDLQSFPWQSSHNILLTCIVLTFRIGMVQSMLNMARGRHWRCTEGLIFQVLPTVWNHHYPHSRHSNLLCDASSANMPSRIQS